jgi:hypothetical protein
MKMRTLAMMCLVLTASVPVRAQERDGRDNPLSAARNLYASARYDEALAVLNGLPADAAGADRKSVEQYRSLCLLALGRGPEAETAIEAVVTADPMFQPAESDASPRVRAAFSDVRQRVLPQIASARYAEAKAAFDRREYKAAEGQFHQVLSLLDDPQMAGRLSDLRILAAGFLELATAAATPPPEPKKAEEPPAPAAPPAPKADPAKIYTADDPGVKPPVIVRQNVPAVPPLITPQAKDHGILELTIDEQGRVASMIVRVSVHPVYDQLLIGAAREWRYQPALLNGSPVKYRKIIQIAVARR